ncbi:hypothetical protein PMAYCL1PPCAC_13583 [Pristionchus mayeri]|uniref:Protein kinase domain-containing protein n=1 Tax=Pristionchus mayeri TaxID=1317129 RepID=A0AAN4ZLE4_9BILA|nr:hypothetical protein PMAYCL1PPCAC_13583 [Pristionchus mayeri]
MDDRKAVRDHANILRIIGEEVRANVNDLKFVSEIGYGDNGHVCNYACQGQNMAVKEKVMICMEEAAACLDRVLRRSGNTPVPEEIIGKIAVIVLTTLVYLMEKHNVVDWSVRPSNILLDWNGTVKLCDIGVSSKLMNPVRCQHGPRSPTYFAPERIDPNASPDHDTRNNVWSLGIIMIELARGKYPYANLLNEFHVLSEILRSEPPVVNQSEGFSEEFVDFVSLLLQKEMERRQNSS